MKAVILLKQTPDTETKIRLSGDGKAIETADVKWVINPYDEYAIEEALRMKEKSQLTEVVILSFGDDRARELILKGLAMGADRGLLIANAGLEDCDSLVTAKVLAAALKAEAPGLVLCGKQGIDDDNMHVVTMVAELLDWPHVNAVEKMTLNGTTLTAEREVEGGQVEVSEMSLPAVVGAHKALNTPRYASLPGIMKAKKKPLDKKSPSDFGLDAGTLKGASRAAIDGFRMPPEKKAGQVFAGEPVEVMVDKVVKLLREEAKII